MRALIELYVKKVIKGEIYIGDVPARWRAEVETEIEKINNENTE